MKLADFCQQICRQIPISMFNLFQKSLFEIAMLVMFVSIFIWNGDGILFAIAMLQDYRDRLLIKRTIKITRNCESPCSYELSVDNGQGDVLTGILPS